MDKNANHDDEINCCSQEEGSMTFSQYIHLNESIFAWWALSVGSPDSRRGTIVYLHGAPTQSYSYRVVMSQVRT